MIKKLLSFLAGPLEQALKRIGKVINQMPDSEELKKLRRSPLFNNPFVKKKSAPYKRKTRKISNPKRKRKAKGPVHSETKIFNKPRK